MTVSVPEVPVTVRVYCPGAAELLVVTVNVLFVVVGFGDHDAVTPLGRPDRDRFTLPLKPYCGYTQILVVPTVPWPRVRSPGERVKLGA